MTTLPAIDRLPPLIAGIDYASRQIDVGRIRGRSLISMETHRLGADLGAQVGVLSRLVMALADEGAAVIVMEQPFIPLNTGRGVTTSLQIREVAIRLETLAAAASLRVEFVAVNTWRSVVLGNGRMKTDAAKLAAMNYVERVYRQRPASHNQADAACLATWGASTVGLEMARRANGGRR